MKKAIIKRSTWFSLTLILICIATACSPKTDGISTETQEQTESIVEAEVVFGTGPFTFPDPSAGLAELTSYKATLTRSFDGTRDGQARNWTQTSILVTTTEPAARQLTIEKSGTLTDPNPVFLIEAGGVAYELGAENTCTATEIDPENSTIERLDPTGYLNFVVGADEAGSETVNGMAAAHYTFDERALGESGYSKSTGEMWVASEGGYILRYVLTKEGSADYFGEGIEGTLTLDYELIEVNSIAAVDVPTDCPTGMVEAPLLPDASNVLKMPSVLSFDTATSLAEAAAFYQEQIPPLGWTIAGEPTITDASALLAYAEGNQELRVLLTAVDGGGTKVHIILGWAGE